MNVISPDKGVNANNDEIKTVLKTPPSTTPRLKKEGEEKATSRKSGGRKRGWKKPRDKPKRPLSAYNLFFQYEREQILNEAPDPGAAKPRRSHGKIGFAPLARSIAAKWSKIDTPTRSHFEILAAKDKERYNKEMKAWNDRMRVVSSSSSKVVTETDSTIMASSNLGTEDPSSFALMYRTEPQYRAAHHHPTMYLPQLNGGWTPSSHEMMSFVSDHNEVSDESITTETDAAGDGNVYSHDGGSDEYSISGGGGGGGGDVVVAAAAMEEMNEALRVAESTLHHHLSSSSKYEDDYGIVVSHHQHQHHMMMMRPPIRSSSSSSQHHLRSFQDSFFDSSSRSPSPLLSPECTPFPFSQMGRRPSIAELASKLDSDSMDLLSVLLRN